MKAALIDKLTSTVIDVIVADASVDAAPNGYMLVNISDAAEVETGSVYNTDGTFSAGVSS